MIKEGLKIISDAMDELSLNYSFGEFTKRPEYPYFVGEYQEFEPEDESGKLETAFMLTGFSRSTWLSLEDAKDKIRQYFGTSTGKVEVTESGSAVAVYYNNSQVIPTGDAELKKIQINLDVKEWTL